MVVGAAALIAEMAVIMAMSVFTGAVWHTTVYGAPGEIASYLGVGATAALLYTLPFAFRSEYRIESLLEGPRSIGRLLNIWTYAFFCLGALAFVTKTTGLASRGWLALFFVLGGAAVVVMSRLLSRAVRSLVAQGGVAPRRLMVIGDREAVAAYMARLSEPATGIVVAATAIVPDAAAASRLDAKAVASLDEFVAEAIERARSVNVGRVLVLADAGRADAFIERVADRLLDLPVAVHIANPPLTDRFPSLRVDRIGSLRTLELRAAPLDSWQLVLKRALDLVAATTGLILIAPLLAIVALLIKLDTPGPVFFRQRRRGFNQREFVIWKFRTMSTLDDGDRIVQARVRDPRVTRVGRILRRFSIDELPQLLNVILGDMSLVGPRPHAVAHDQHYERIIKRYQRRLNVKPGITGWAQVNGYRGPTDDDHAMRSRIAHDLYYIDQWSLAFDLYIIVLTVLSPKAFRNAL